MIQNSWRMFDRIRPLFFVSFECTASWEIRLCITWLLFCRFSDVDTPQPDEKSLITYISSLYDVFPEVPPMPPLVDKATLQKLDEYKDLASTLYIWLRDNTQMLQDRNFPNTLVEMKVSNNIRIIQVAYK